MTSPAPHGRRRYNSWFVTVPLLAGGLAFVFWFYRPTQRQIGDMQGELELKQAVLADAAALPLRLKQTNQELRDTRAFVAAWQRTAAEKSLAAVCGDLAGIVAAAGAKATKFEPEPAARYRYLTRSPCTLACEGTFPQIYQVLRQLERMPQTIWVEDVQITREGKNSAAVTCTLKLAMFTGQSNSADKTD
jgi:Tfp pilus assembly protein PilO